MTPQAIAAELGLRDAQITPLSGGSANQSWRLRDASQDLVLRQSGSSASTLGANGRLELAMIRLAASATLAPQPVLARPEAGILVTQYVGGHVLTRDDAVRPAMLERIGRWFAKLHSLAAPPGFAAIDFGARAQGYLAQLRAHAALPFLPDLDSRLAVKRGLLTPPLQLTACHHDLHHLNLVDRVEALIALDWEYSGPGDPAADLAACIGYHDLDSQQTAALIGGYGDDSPALRARLAALCWIFDCLWLGWLEVAALQGIDTDAGRRRLLVERLLR